ncbi:probable aspartyl protease At4g16563 [Amborella trichopoda]|uniref:Peptidase A1 domain-containing protein n=1 Tax=Amborella trichopoda TaxID=13333 RepID=U5D158_AMBTC|nr:probable aspartyl protease At4g16563 [Amborella trichopoda]ERN16159.1 hypothetical protein AMTR_s00030p00224790 [Amborella trichopoda]|eukprot:XP_006854692.1 probable aspartyl protease At4g16563 [Amborella trichopoda]
MFSRIIHFLALQSLFPLVLSSHGSLSLPFSLPLQQSQTRLSQDDPQTLTLSLERVTPKPTSDPYHKLSIYASTSLARAQLLKRPKFSKNATTFEVPLSPLSYGGYTVTLDFGTPPQPLSFIMDTGSELVWFPCTSTYICAMCPNPIPTFFPKQSTSAKLVGCLNPKCKWISESSGSISLCKSRVCSPYIVQYGSGSTSGLLLSETLNLKSSSKFEDFVVGCSLISSRLPSGIAGFGRGNLSLPDQLNLGKFSYCLVSHKFDNTNKSSTMQLGALVDESNLEFTPFLKNPISENKAFQVYYYLGLRKITVGGKKVKIPYELLKLEPSGNGGCIIDSGTTFTFMEREIFDRVAEKFEAEVGLEREKAIEESSGLRPCFNVSKGENLTLPKLGFHFKGGATMELPLENYFAFFGETQAVCLTILTDNGNVNGSKVGPSIILGNFQQQNYYIVYDIEKGRLGFRPQEC